MKKKDLIILIILLSLAGALIVFSSSAKQGAMNGLILAQNTIIPSLTPLLMIFLIIMKTGAKDIFAKFFGFIAKALFNLPYVAFPAIFFGMVGGYPTGALLTKELFDAGEIDLKQAKRMMCFNFCGGCGFIITAVGTVTLNSDKAGVILYISSLLSSIIIGVALSFTEKRSKETFYSFTPTADKCDLITSAVNSAVNSVLNITAFVILFSAVSAIVPISKQLLPLIEITAGICGHNRFSLAMMSAYLAFGGLCIHFQLIGILKQVKMKYFEFFAFRVLSAILSYLITKIILLIFPVELSVFADNSIAIEFSSVNLALSALMILGCFVSVFDISSKKKNC